FAGLTICGLIIGCRSVVSQGCASFVRQKSQWFVGERHLRTNPHLQFLMIERSVEGDDVDCMRLSRLLEDSSSQAAWLPDTAVCDARGSLDESQPSISFVLLLSQSQPSKSLGNGEGLPTWQL
ncbi:hypothetical protein Tco_1323335, partial [Tanacetum coccineum]